MKNNEKTHKGIGGKITKKGNKKKQIKIGYTFKNWDMHFTDENGYETLHLGDERPLITKNKYDWKNPVKICVTIEEIR